MVPGLGVFAVIQEQFHSKEEAVSVRRPVFQMDLGVLWLEDVQSPNEIVPDCVKIEPLNYRQLARATAFPLHVVQLCVQETILLYCHFLKNKVHISFAFKHLRVLTCKDDFLCMRFYYNCIAMLESNARPIAALHSVS
ncbi:coiled-coil domain-containing protein 81-like [Numida meleagris]|uniref:coiled-coil domain-containing protein 81-like n=1 Tax=Numida meleagris TaxID=8996 RepID=UPI000B3DCBE9|nr:coiled-coil domain-containing protein 81-like [Numida meleagris]